MEGGWRAMDIAHPCPPSQQPPAVPGEAGAWHEAAPKAGVRRLHVGAGAIPTAPAHPARARRDKDIPEMCFLA